MHLRLIAVVSVLVAALACVQSAAANWGKENKCSGTVEPTNKHCYSQASQAVGNTYKTEGLFNEDQTVNMYVPRAPSGYENFVTNEAWTSFGSEEWIETGQMGGNYSSESLNPFVAAFLAKSKFVINYVDPEIGLAKNTWYDYWDIDVDPTNGTWCVYWFYSHIKEAYEHGPVHCQEKWTRYDSNVITAGLEAGSYYEPEANGNQIVETAAPHHWYETWSTWTKGQVAKQIFPAGTCGANNPWWNEYPGSITFGAGTGVCGGKEGEITAVAPSGLPEASNGWAIHALPSSGAPIGMDRVRQIATEHAHAPTGTLSVSQGNTWEAMSAFPAVTGYTPITKDNERWMTRSAYLVTMHGTFTYGGPQPANSSPFTGNYLAMIIDAQTGEVTAQYYGDTAPTAAGPVTTLAEE